MVHKRALHAAMAATAFVGLLGLSAARAGEISASMLAETCNGCHGPDGSSFGPATPAIAGMNKMYLQETMEAYKRGDRPSTIMARIAKGYSSDEIKMIAEYFNGKTLVRRIEQTADATLAEKGKGLTREYCDDCHEKDGYSAVDYPALAGQPISYLSYQIADLLAGKRDLEKNAALSDKERKKKLRKLEGLKEKEGMDGFKAATHFYGSLK